MRSQTKYNHNQPDWARCESFRFTICLPTLLALRCPCGRLRHRLDKHRRGCRASSAGERNFGARGGPNGNQVAGFGNENWIKLELDMGYEFIWIQYSGFIWIWKPPKNKLDPEKWIHGDGRMANTARWIGTGDTPPEAAPMHQCTWA